MRRREFLRRSGGSAVALSLLPGHGWAQAAAGQAASWDALIADLERKILPAMDEAKTPGTSIAIIKDAKVLWRRGFGVRDRATKAPVDVDTTFEAASVSKTVFAYAVMKLCEKGVLALDTPLTKYTSDRPVTDPRLDAMTVRHVLSHTGGFQNWSSDKEPLKIHFTPGEKYQYSGEGYAYLQSVVTKVTKQAIDPFMRASVLTPFGMTSSGYVWSDLFEKRAARGHDEQGKPRSFRKSTAADMERYAAAGGLMTTPTDYAKFLIEIIDPKPADAFRLNGASLKEMVRPQVAVEGPISWALGWTINKTEQGTLIQHGGSNPGFQCWIAASIAHKCGLVIMTNSDSGDTLLRNPAFKPILERCLSE